MKKSVRIDAPNSSNNAKKRLGYIGLAPITAVALLLLLFGQMNALPQAATNAHTIRYVTDTGSGTACTSGTPCTFPQAVTQSIDGDEIRVAGGTYNVNLIVTQTITMSGGFNSADWAALPNPIVYETILDGNNTDSVIRLTGVASPTIEGFTIQNGSAADGAGIHNIAGAALIRNNIIRNNNGSGIEDQKSATILNNKIYGNQTTGSGGGILILNDAQTLTNILFNEIYSNTASGNGGGIFVSGSDANAFIEGNTIYENTGSLGGGIGSFAPSTLTAQNNIIYLNTATNEGGGILVLDNADIWNNTIANNSSTGGGGGIRAAGGNVQISNTIVVSNTGGSPTGIESTGATLSGDYNNIFGNVSDVAFTNTISTDPQFSNYGNYNLHLGGTSPNINTGDTNTSPAIDQDIDLEARPNDGAWDIGADEYYPDVPNFTLTPPFVTTYEPRNTTAVYTNTLANTGTISDSYTISCGNDLGWTVTCTNNINNLDVGNNANVILDVNVPNLPALTVANSYITATSTFSPTLIRYAQVRTIVAPSPGVQFTPNYSQTLLPGATITFTHRITNSGDSPDTFDLAVTSNDPAWLVQILPAEPYSISLGSGASANIDVQITVPAYAATSFTNTTTIRASSRFDPSYFAEVEDTITPEPTVGTRYVGLGGNDNNNNCTQKFQPCATIAQALGQASSGDNIYLRETFGGSYNESDLNINDTVHISGGWDFNYSDQGNEGLTIVNAQGLNRIFNIAPGNSIRPSISNLTLQNGDGGSQGGAVNVGNNAQPSFENVVFKDNSAGQGGAIYIGSNSIVRITKGQFYTNTANIGDGGAVYNSNSTVTLDQSQFFANIATNGDGAGLAMNNGQLSGANNLFAQGTAVNGAGLYINGGTASLTHQTFADNTATGSGGAIYNNTATLNLVSSIVVSNTAPTASAINNPSGTVTTDFGNFFGNNGTQFGGTVTSNNSFTTDPLFADAEYRLALGSPMIDTGSPAATTNVDFEDDFRPTDQGFDVGYDEVIGCLAQRDDTIFGSIQDAIDMPTPVSDLITVSGICRGVNTIDYNGSPISQTVHLTETLTIQGGWNSDFSEQTFEATYIDPQGRGRGIFVVGNIQPIVESIIIINGDATGLAGGPNDEDAGGGIYNADAQPTFTAVSVYSSTAQLGGAIYNNDGQATYQPIFIENNLIEYVRGQIMTNTATLAGAAYYAYSGTVTIDGVEMINNSAPNGAGVYNENAIITATNNILAGNSGTNGAGFYNSSPMTTTVLHNTFFSNTVSNQGGGLYSSGGPISVTSNIFDRNGASSGPAIFANGGTITADYNYYYDDATPVVGTSAGSNSISSTSIEPGLTDPNNGDFHLLEDAPAIDNGDPNSPILRDYEDDPRPSDQGPDIGADETVGCLVRINEVNTPLYGSIQAALLVANNGDILDVAGICKGVHQYDTGTPLGTIAVNLHIDKNVTLRGGWNEQFDLRESITILDAEGNGRVVYFAPAVTATLDRFHIIQGSADNGAGIYIDNAAPQILSNNIYSNTATASGAGIYSNNSTPTIDKGNRIYENNAPDGAGITLFATLATTVATVQNNFIYQNSATATGGGILNDGGDNLLWQNTLVDNSALTGGAIYANNDDPDIRGNLIISNTATNTGGAYGLVGTTPTIGYNNFYQNTNGDVGGQINSGGTGSQTLDPLFTTDQYTLTYASPVVSLSDPSLTLTHDFEDDFRPSHQGIDIGADEVGGCFARNAANPSTVYGSLQQVVDLATDGDLIEFDGECLGVNTRNNGATNVTQNLYISKSLTIDGNNWDFTETSPLTATLNAVDLGRVVYVHSGATVTLTRMILQNGEATSAGINNNGGGVYNNGTLVLDQVYLSENNASNGGGVYNASRLTMQASFVGPNNTAVNGAGFYNDAPGTGQATINNQTTISNNLATGNGAAVYQNNGDLMLDGNHIYANATTLDGTIYLAPNDDPIDVRNNFIYNNIATTGGGVYNDTTANIWHNTLYGNNATSEQGGGIYATNTNANIDSNIVDNNTGTGIHVPNGTTVLYNNVLDNFPTDYAGGILSPDASNISLTPLYQNPGVNFRLVSGSPGEDVANLALGVPNDIDNDIRPTNGGPDIGADEINTCLVRVNIPGSSDYNYYGVLQSAINYAESRPELPNVEIARGECRGVVSDAGVATQQVAHVTEDLLFIGSLVRATFADENDFGNAEIGRYTSILNAEEGGRVIRITNGANPEFRQLAFIRGDATQGGANGNGGAFYNNTGGELTLFGGYVCENKATNGAGYYGDTSFADITGVSFGRCIVAQVIEDENGNIVNPATDVYYRVFLGNEATDQGGGIWNNGRFDLRNVSFDSNSAGTNGAGIYNTGSNNRIINGTFYLNQSNSNGAGLYNSGSNLRLYHNTYRDNTVLAGSGAAIYNAQASMTLNSSIVYSNTASSGFAVDNQVGAITIEYSNFNDNFPADSNAGTGTNAILTNPQLGLFAPTLLTQYSPVIDQADPALLISGAPGTAPYGTVIVDFDRQLDIRPDGDPNHIGPKGSDMGSDEYYKDFGCAIEFIPKILPFNQIASQANPGDTVVYTFDLINTGDKYPPEIGQPFNGYNDTITLTIQSTSQGWATLDGGDPQTFNLDWLDSVQGILTVTVPIDAQSGMQESTVLLCESSARPGRNGTGTAQTNVGLTSNLIVEPPYVDTAQPGDVITYTHTITNGGNNPAIVSITPNAGPQHASADLVDINGNVLTDTVVTLNSLATQTVYLRVTILDTAESGDIANPGVVATEIDALGDPVDPLNQGSVINAITILPAPGTRYVATTSSADNTNCTDPAQPCATIQHAVSQAVAGDDILISQGTYTSTTTQAVGADSFTQNIFLNKSVNLRGGYDVADGFTSYQPITNATYLDGLDNNRVIFITNTVTPTISSLFILNGQPDPAEPFADFGGGIYNNGANLTITGTWILSNTARYGAGVYNHANQLLVNSSVFANNDNQRNPSNPRNSGAAIFAQGDTVIVENSTFANNSASDTASRVAALAGTPLVGAATGNGGGIFVSTGTLKALNNIFYNGTADLDGSAIYISPTVTISNDYNIYWTNGNPNFLSTGIVTGSNSVVTDPLFIDNYYHIDTTSPAKDTGTNTGLTILDVDFELDGRPQGIGVDIGADERIQRPGFEFTPITQTATITTGTAVTYTHLLTTTGDFADNYALTMTNQTIGTGFTFALSPTTITGLDTGQSVTVTLVVTGGIPGGLNVTTITATAASTLVRTVEDTTIISQTAGVDIEPSQSSIGLPTQTITYSHTLTNTGDGIDEFTLSILSETPSGWNVTLTPTQTGFLLNGESIPFTVTVAVPAGTLSDTVQTVEIIANATNPDASDILTDTTTVGPAYGLTLIPDNAQTVADGVTAVYTHTLQNTGNQTDTVTLSFLSTPNWAVQVEPPSVVLQPLETQEIVVSVTVPTGTGGMIHTAEITASSQSGLTATAVNTTTVQIDRNVILDPNSILQDDAGQTVTHTHTLTNTGNITGTFDLTAASNAGWLDSFTPGPILLGPGMTATVTATMTIPPTALPPDEDITVITATSQTDPLVYDITVDTTQVSTNWGLIFVPDNSGTAPGFSVITYTHYLTNTGNAADTFTINSNSSNGWTVTTFPASPFGLNRNEGTPVVVSITIPLGASGLSDVTTLTAVSANPSYFATVTDTTNISGTAGTLSVTIAPDNIGIGLPATTVQYQHTVTNTGDITATFSITAVSSNGWNITIPTNNVQLNPLASQDVTISVDIPAGTLSGTVDILTVTAYADANSAILDTATDTTTVGQGGGVLIAPDNTQTTNPNTTISYQHTITNLGNGTDTFTVTASTPLGWPIVVDPPVTIGGGLTNTVLVTLTVPVGTDGLVEPMVVTATSSFDPLLWDTAVNTTTVNIIGPPPTRSVIIAPDLNGIGDPGETITYTHTITNLGNVTEQFTINAIPNQAWAVFFSPNNTTLLPNQSTSIIVRVSIPAGASGGDMARTTVSAYSSAGTSGGATNTTTVRLQQQDVYLPIILNNYSAPINPTPTPIPPNTPTPTPTISPTPCSPTGVDLVVTSIQVQPGTPSSGQAATVLVTIRNQGGTDVAFGNNFFLDFYDNRLPGFALSGDVSWGVQGADLSAGASRTFTAPYTFSGGTHQLYAQVDTDNNVDECPNEGNNILGPILLTVTGQAGNETGEQSVPNVGDTPRQTPTPAYQGEREQQVATPMP